MIAQVTRLLVATGAVLGLLAGGAAVAGASPASAHPDGVAAPATFVAVATEATLPDCKAWLSADNSSGHWYVDFHVESWGNAACTGHMQRSTDSGRHWADFGDPHRVTDGGTYNDPNWYYDGVNTSNHLDYEMRVNVCSPSTCSEWSQGY